MHAPADLLTRKGGSAAVVVAIHVAVLYVIAASLGVVRSPVEIAPIEAVMIDAPAPTPPMERIETPPKLSQPTLNVETAIPQIPVEVPIEMPPPAPDALTTSPVEPVPQEPVHVANLSVKSRANPVYPAASRRVGEEGTAVLRVLVDERGRAREVTVFQSSGYHRLDDAAIEAIRQWTFNAAMKGTQPVSAWTTVKVTFRLDR